MAFIFVDCAIPILFTCSGSRIWTDTQMAKDSGGTVQDHSKLVGLMVEKTTKEVYLGSAFGALRLHDRGTIYRPPLFGFGKFETAFLATLLLNELRIIYTLILRSATPFCLGADSISGAVVSPRHTQEIIPPGLAFCVPDPRPVVDQARYLATNKAQPRTQNAEGLYHIPLLQLPLNQE
ncbi:hypothetical protein BX600DRAFT_430851 [Xylariales sp. PMI_506]|nr:hypothetical protein BX600DRAFT_430851 [Xylariales sp. PMI_506]